MIRIYLTNILDEVIQNSYEYDVVREILTREGSKLTEGTLQGVSQRAWSRILLVLWFDLALEISETALIDVFVVVCGPQICLITTMKVRLTVWREAPTARHKLRKESTLTPFQPLRSMERNK